ncbi:FecR domain-containing protein [Bradyrhizobium sp. Leo170]|uniref:FecR family protein n=1 Tax=Bradyrhizobium sp. Leo170 TaxID=1571199 RepID=UPI001FE1DEE7|nr:FecR domain-containing protein [Bradyrhizobium sp. Leo170]
MTVPNRPPKSNPLLDEALDWVVRLKTDEPTRADVDALQRWRDQSQAHDAAFKKAVQLFRMASVAARELADEQQASDVVVTASQPPPRRLTRRIMLGGAIAAAAAGYMIVRPPLGLWPSLEELSADYRTGKGEHRKVAVAPDVSLELNTQTSVALRSTSDETRIELISGEASVAAKLSPSKPLVMLAGNGRISASQADFNARCLDGVVSVTCLDGVVTVEQNDRTVQLHKAEQVTYSSAGLQQSVPVDAVQVTAWQAGLLIFRDRPLASVVDEVNRYRPGKIIIANAELKRRLVNGTFQLDKLGNFVDQVEQLFGARITSLPGGVVLLS